MYCLERHYVKIVSNETNRVLYSKDVDIVDEQFVGAGWYAARYIVLNEFRKKQSECPNNRQDLNYKVESYCIGMYNSESLDGPWEEYYPEFKI